MDLTTLSSNFHVEMNPSDAGMKDRYVVQARPRTAREQFTRSLSLFERAALRAGADAQLHISLSFCSCGALALTPCRLNSAPFVSVFPGGNQGDGQGEASRC